MEKLELKSLSGSNVYLLDAEETELLHVNYNYSKIEDAMLVQLRFTGVRPVAGTDMYDVGVCQVSGKSCTILATKENIVAAQSSTLDPLVNIDRNGTTSLGKVALNQTAEAVTLDKPVAKRGAFTGYIL